MGARRRARPQRLSRIGHHSRHHHGVLRADWRLERDLFQPLDTTSDWGAGHGVRIPEYAELLVLLDLQPHHDFLPFRGRRCGIWWMDSLPTLERVAAGDAGLRHGHDPLADFHGAVRGELFAGWPELHRDCDQPSDQRHENAAVAADHLGLPRHCYFGRVEFPCIGICCGVVAHGPFHGYGVLPERYFHRW